MSKNHKKNVKLGEKYFKKNISNAELVKMLKTRFYSEEELNELKVSELQILELQDLGYKVFHQFDPIQKCFVYYVVDKGEDPFVFLPKTDDGILKCAKMADIHIGSNEFDKEEFIQTLESLWKSGVRIILIAGDVVDGKHVYSGHDENLQWRAQMQLNAAVALLSQFNFIYITCKGNHDDSYIKNGGIDILEAIETRMAQRKKTFTYLRSYVGYVCFNDAVIKLIHLGSNRGSTISETYPSQKNLDSMFKTSTKYAKSNVNDIKLFGKIYPIINLISGHFHILSDFTYGWVFCESPLTFQHTTDFINRMGNHSRVGCKTAEMKIKDGQCISEKSSILFIENLQEIHDMTKRHKNIRDISEKSAKKLKHDKANIEMTDEKLKVLNKALKKLYRKGFAALDEIGLTKEEIEYLNQKYQYNIYIQDGRAVLKTDDDSNSCIVSSPLPETGIISYMEISNLLIGSKFFNEASLRYMLDIAKEQKIRHIHLGGDIVWGKPIKKLAKFTKFFSSESQANEVIRILSDYTNFHYYAINGDREQTFISAMGKENEINPLFKVSQELKDKNIKFTYINSDKCDFVIMGLVFRMLHEGGLKKPYTRDYPIVIPERNAMAKAGNKVIINGQEFDLGAMYYGSIPNAQNTYYGGVYVTTTAGPTYDPQNISDIIQSNPNSGINTIYVKNGTILKLTREVIMPPKKICLSQYIQSIKNEKNKK